MRKKIRTLIGTMLLLGGIVVSFSHFATAKSNAASIQYSLKSDYWLYNVYYVGTGYCPSSSKNDGTVTALWGYPECR